MGNHTALYGIPLLLMALRYFMAPFVIPMSVRPALLLRRGPF